MPRDANTSEKARRTPHDQLRADVQTALVIFERDGEEDSPLAAFLRAALARATGATP